MTLPLGDVIDYRKRPILGRIGMAISESLGLVDNLSWFLTFGFFATKLQLAFLFSRTFSRLRFGVDGRKESL